MTAPVPKIALDIEQLTELYQHAPHWHACVLGPIPFGDHKRLHLTLDYMIQPDYDTAESVVWSRVEEACGVWEREFDPGEWDLAHLVLMNGS